MSRRSDPDHPTPRLPAPDVRPVGLTIAGSDSGGGAGIQADIRTMAAHGAFPTSVLTSVTAQNTRGVDSAFTLPLAEILAQYEAVVDDFDVRAAKTGMLAEAPVVEAVAGRVADLDAPLVVDPVMVATSGDRLLSREGERAYEELIGEATLVTPNREEAAVLTDVEPRDPDSARAAGEQLLELGSDAALVKGGHGDGNRLVDVLVTADGAQEFTHPRIDTDATHGSGCVLSSAITAQLAADEELQPAVDRSIRFIQRAIRYPLDVGGGAGPVHPLVELREQAARGPVSETVTALADDLIDRNARELVPEVGTNVVGATPYAESIGETMAVEGRIRRTLDGLAVARGVRSGASSHVARFLLAAREFTPDLRFAANVVNDEATRHGLEELDAPVVALDRGSRPEGTSTAAWMARETFGDAVGRDDPDGVVPAAVLDDGDIGTEPMIRLVAADAQTLARRLRTVLTGAREHVRTH